MRKTLLLLGVLLTGCTSKGNWKHSQLENTAARFGSSRLSYVSSENPNNMKLEIIRKSRRYTGYLSVGPGQIPAMRGGNKQAEISVQIGDEKQSYLVSRYEGGQRLLLPENLLGKIIDSLKAGTEVTILASGYSLTLSPEGFASQYEKFEKTSKIPQLIQSPF
jgi:hypothetical protein